MATVEDLGKKMKAKFPGQYDDLPDIELGRRVKAKYPEYSDFQEIAQGPVTETQGPPALFKEAKKRGLMLEQQAAQKSSEEATTSEKQLGTALSGVKIGAEMAPFMLAAPFTAGATLPAALGVMAGAGVASGATREALDAWSGTNKKTPVQIAKSLGLDAVLGAGTEFGIRGLAKIGGALWERSILKAAHKTEAGRAVAEETQTRAFQTLEQSVVGREGNIKAAGEAFLEKLGNIPHGRGKTGEMLAGGIGGDVGELAARIKADLVASHRASSAARNIGEVEVVSAGYGRAPMTENLLPGPSAITKEIPWGNQIPALGRTPLVDPTKQPLDALVRMHSTANKIAWAPNPDVPQAARVAAKEYAEDLNKVILSKLNPKERDLFEAAKAITKETEKYSVGVQVARYLLRKSLAGAVGAAAGGYAGGSEGAKIGGVVGITGSIGLEALEKKYAPVLLESWVNHNKASWQKAMTRLMDEGAPLAEVGDSVWRSLGRAIPIEVMERIKESVTKPQQSQLAPSH